jgi:hypothetical protein
MRRTLLLIAAIAALTAPALAHADGDPASDWLLTQPSFVPPDDGIPSAYAKQLNAVLADAKARGYEIRVAIIGTRYDLGSVYVDWKKPQPYARFLGKELFFVYKKRLLVSMPNGLSVTGGNGNPDPAEQAIVDHITPTGTNGAALTAAATQAVVKLAANQGIVITPPPLGKGGTTTSQNQDRVIIAAVALLAAAAIVVVGFVRRRGKVATP